MSGSDVAGITEQLLRRYFASANGDRLSVICTICRQPFEGERAGMQLLYYNGMDDDEREMGDGLHVFVCHPDCASLEDPMLVYAKRKTQRNPQIIEKAVRDARFN
ncbi:MAG: hypothetical protein PHS14_18105 [Elusimicrobia bacterium]|nr:hypothetical protein [Elusimicrobiota bacterium]